MIRVENFILELGSLCNGWFYANTWTLLSTQYFHTCIRPCYLWWITAITWYTKQKYAGKNHQKKRVYFAVEYSLSWLRQVQLRRDWPVLESPCASLRRLLCGPKKCGCEAHWALHQSLPPIFVFPNAWSKPSKRENSQTSVWRPLVTSLPAHRALTRPVLVQRPSATHPQSRLPSLAHFCNTSLFLLAWLRKQHLLKACPNNFSFFLLVVLTCACYLYTRYELN